MQKWPQQDIAQSIASACDVLALDVSKAQRDALGAYLALLHKWNRVYNLTAVRDPASMLTHHVLDSVVAWQPVARYMTSVAEPAVLDVGSGGGLPGVAWAILAPVWSVTCVDAVAKKVGFIQQCALELQLSGLSAVHSRVEQLHARPWPLITSRAFASLGDFVHLTRSVLAPQGVWVAMKGKWPEDEIAALPADVEVFHVEQVTVPGLAAARCLIWMRPCA